VAPILTRAVWQKLQVAEGGQGVYESSKVRMKIAPSFWSAIYTIPTVLVLQALIIDHCAKVSHRKHTNLSRSIEEQKQ